jgi:hypothetical protein
MYLSPEKEIYRQYFIVQAVLSSYGKIKTLSNHLRA